MKIISSKQTQQLDQYTIENEPITSIDLMERAACAFVHAFIKDFSDDNKVAIICGNGNNGGDGLAIARLLYHANYSVEVYLTMAKENGSSDFQENFQRLEGLEIKCFELTSVKNLQKIKKEDIIIDALFGSGLNRPIENFLATIVEWLNQSKNKLIAIDIPSGVYANKSINGIAIKADKTYSFELPKLAFFMPENQAYIGEWKILDIQLSKEGLQKTKTPYRFLTKVDARQLLIDRAKFSHKGTFGHLLLVAGSEGKAGAAILAAKSSLRSGIGLLSIYVQKELIPILQIAVPEAMCLLIDKDQLSSKLLERDNYKTIAIGPGWGTKRRSVKLLENILDNFKQPVVLDADALNILSEHPKLIRKVTSNSILTPHPGEFRRLVGTWKNDYDRLEKQIAFSKKYKVIVVLKGAYTSITNPKGDVSFNSSGNNGMATAGSGDTLTGIIAGLVTQGYPTYNAARLGVYLHGLAGDFALEKEHKMSLIASDITFSLGRAIREIENFK